MPSCLAVICKGPVCSTLGHGNINYNIDVRTAGELVGVSMLWAGAPVEGSDTITLHA